MVNEHCSTAILCAGSALAIVIAFAAAVHSVEMIGDAWRTCLAHQAGFTNPEVPKYPMSLKAPGRARLRYLLYYLLTRPPFLIIMNLPIGHRAVHCPPSLLEALRRSPKRISSGLPGLLRPGSALRPRAARRHRPSPGPCSHAVSILVADHV